MLTQGKWLISAIGTALEYIEAWTRRPETVGHEKGRIQMSGQSKIMSTVIAAIASILVSSVAVGAAVGPATGGTNPVGVVIHA